MSALNLNVDKSPRHSKITGDFAEYLVLYWLSKYGFECLHVDHVAIDIIATSKRLPRRIGISVKSRSRNSGKEGIALTIPRGHTDSLGQRCKEFDCDPYYAIVVDEGASIVGFILSQDHLLSICPPANRAISWKMTKAWMERYENDKDIKMFRFVTKTSNWWPDSPSKTPHSLPRLPA